MLLYKIREDVAPINFNINSINKILLNNKIDISTLLINKKKLNTYMILKSKRINKLKYKILKKYNKNTSYIGSRI